MKVAHLPKQAPISMSSFLDWGYGEASHLSKELKREKKKEKCLVTIGDHGS